MEFKKWLYLERNSNNLIKILNKSYSFLIFLYTNNNFKNEASAVVSIPEELLNSSSCGKWCMWIKRFNPKFKSNPKQKVVCGSEGCALFAGNKVVIKFTKGKEEATIATLIKGNPNFPVIDTTYYNFIYAIAMRELNDVHFASSLRHTIAAARNVVIDFFKHENINVNESLYEQYKKWYELVKKQTNEIDQEELNFSYKLIQLIDIIKDKTGYILGDDWGYYNLGFDDQNQVQPFDFGYPKLRYNSIPKTAEIPSLEQ
jgi:hypothetical protein